MAPTMRPTTSDPTLTPSARPFSSPSSSPTDRPTASPVFNKFFCGKDYFLAEQNCWTNDVCSATVPCTKPGEECFIISAERCMSAEPTGAPTGPGPRPSASPTRSAAPTSSPTDSLGPTASPTDSPSRSPIVNTNFCGANYFDAKDNCAETLPCPSGVGCPAGMNCFPGIACAPLAGEGPPSDAMAVMDEGNSPTKSPVTWLQALGVGTAKPTLNNKFCGLNPQDAAERCMTTGVPCPDGVSQGVCFGGQSCFPVPGGCGATTGSDDGATMTTGDATTGGDDGMAAWPPADPQTQPATTPAPVEDAPLQKAPAPSPEQMGAAFNPDATSFCGSDYKDASEYCYERFACPSNSNAECPGDQTCYPGIQFCQSPPPTTSTAPTNGPPPPPAPPSMAAGGPATANSALEGP